MSDSNQFESREAPDFAFLVGIDWASTKHDICVIDAAGRIVKQEQIQQSTETIDNWVEDLQRQADGKPIAIALEQTKGALIYALMQRVGVYLFPINPQQFAAYRKSFSNINAKHDAEEALLLARFLFERRRSLRMWEPDDEVTRLVGQLAQARREAVNERTRLSLQLRESLMKYFPALLQITSNCLGESQPLLAVVKKWPDPAVLKRARLCDIVRTLVDKGVGKAKAAELAEKLRSAPVHCRDRVTAQVHAMKARDLAERLLLLGSTIERYDEALRVAVAEHPDRQLYENVRGLGKALLPRVIAAFGSRRDRFSNAQEAANFCGMSPVCRQSGKMRQVVRRRACNKFMLQTFHELAASTISWTPWAKAFYRYQRDRGMKHHAAVRKLARCWVRILYRVWKDKVPYDEARYQQTFKAKNPEIARYLTAA